MNEKAFKELIIIRQKVYDAYINTNRNSTDMILKSAIGNLDTLIRLSDYSEQSPSEN